MKHQRLDLGWLVGQDPTGKWIQRPRPPQPVLDPQPELSEQPEVTPQPVLPQAAPPGYVPRGRMAKKLGANPRRIQNMQDDGLPYMRIADGSCWFQPTEVFRWIREDPERGSRYGVYR